MIEFKGELSDECKNFVQKKFVRGLRLSCFIVIIIFSTLVTVVALSYERIVFLFLIVQVPFLLLLYPVPSMMPLRIEIGEDYLAVECETIDGKRSSLLRNLIDVKQVIDMGNWYYISFYFPHKTIFFTCQKDLISQGTIEEFETLFEDTLVRQIDS